MILERRSKVKLFMYQIVEDTGLDIDIVESSPHYIIADSLGDAREYAEKVASTWYGRGVSLWDDERMCWYHIDDVDLTWSLVLVENPYIWATDINSGQQVQLAIQKPEMR